MNREAFRILPGRPYARNGREAAHPNLWQRLVECWNPGVLAASGNGVALKGVRLGTLLTGAASRFVTEGKVALGYNGTNQYVTSARRTEFGDVSGDFSVSVWLKVKATPGGYPLLLGQAEDFKGFALFFDAGTGKISSIASQNGSGWNYGINSGQGVPYTVNTWLNVITRKTGATFNTPKDGIVSGQQTGSFSGTPQNTSTNGIFSGKHYSLANYGNFEVGEMCIWHRYLSDAEVYQVGALGYSPLTKVMNRRRLGTATAPAGPGARTVAVVVCC